ncbi:hypothetical protein FisN_27Lh045 [Fistulifera solaris]|uniref:Replication termination factor 2 n=1 Tax=Fistulifera solaris TaxID=1519565 RepID=A0A1Z5JHQ9_FISSO|nr:hypothetical protein FisN_27Lh045 [Fistulifera solaris]|eukprot:GAX13547.1 hypothetical protein FisN_27Lh045 [Fistulifera solaris]
MGGDGGVIASNRRYMRGAGTAEHKEHRDEALEREEMARTMQVCAASSQPLQFSRNTIVTCPYGNLYHKEAAVEALLRRKQEDAVLGDHIRGLKDLHEVRFHIMTSTDGAILPTCPITGRELNGNIPAVALIPGRPGQCNVVSERGMQEMGDDFVIEYGPVEDKIRLAPPLDILAEIKAKLEEKRAKKSKKKRKEQSHEADRLSKKSATNVTAVARDKVNDAFRENTVFSSLFSRDGVAVSDKDKKDNLFAR